MRTKLILLLVCTSLLLAACPQQTDNRRALKPPNSAVADKPSAPAAVGSNLFASTPMIDDHPSNVELNREGDVLLFSVFHSSPAKQLVVSADFAGGQLNNAREVNLTTSLAKAFLTSHPAGDRGLILGNYQNPGGPVIDKLIEVELNKSPRVLRYEDTPGLPDNAPPDDMYGIEAIYSWDGETIIIPLKYSGIVVYSLTGKGRHFLPYPELGFPRTGKSVQALEDQNNKRRVLVSVWAQEVYVDACKLYTLDLDSLEYKHIADLNWVAYNVGCTDYDNEPWLVTGSRGRETAVDIKRTPLLYFVDPSGSSAMSKVQYYGDPLWQVEVSTHGDTVVYLDEQREAIVRLHPLTGLLEIDRKNYNPAGELLVSADGKKVFIWERDELYHANFNEKESFPPYGGE